MSLRQWALSGVDSVTAEKAATLRQVLGNVEAALRQVDSTDHFIMNTTHGAQ